MPFARLATWCRRMPAARLAGVGATVGLVTLASLVFAPPAYSARDGVSIVDGLALGEDTTNGVTVPASDPLEDSIRQLYPPPNPMDSTDAGPPDGGVEPGDPSAGDPPTPGGTDEDLDDVIQGAGSKLSADDVVSATCRTADRVRRLATEVGAAYETFGAVKDLAGVFFGASVPVSDPLATAAAHGWARAAREGAKAEQWAAALGIGAMCNTSEIKRLTEAQFDFVRNVVNRGIEAPLPRIDDVLDRLDSATAPVAAAVRDARMTRLFARSVQRPNVMAPSVADVAADSAIRAAMAASYTADSVATLATSKIREFQEQLFPPPEMRNGRPVCFSVTAQGDTAWIPVPPTQQHCTASPGRMQQLMAEEGNLTNAQLLHSNALQARRMELEYTKYQIEFRQNLLQRSTALISARW